MGNRRRLPRASIVINPITLFEGFTTQTIIKLPCVYPVFIHNIVIIVCWHELRI
jgi:hypothetical protein